MNSKEGSSFLQKYGKQLALITSIGAGAALVYAYFSLRLKNQAQEKKEYLFDKDTTRLEKMKSPIDMTYGEFKEVIREKVSKGHILDISHLISILDLIRDKVAPQFFVLLTEGRILRREARKSGFNAYYEAQLQYEDKLDILLSSCSETVVGELDLPLDIYQQSFMFQFEENQDFSTVVNLQPSLLVSKMPFKTSLDTNGVINYLQFLIHEIPRLETTAIKDLDYDQRAEILQPLIHDLAFESLGIEEEQYLAFINNNVDNLDSRIKELIFKMGTVFQEKISS